MFIIAKVFSEDEPDTSNEIEISVSKCWILLPEIDFSQFKFVLDGWDGGGDCKSINGKTAFSTSSCFGNIFQSYDQVMN